MCGFTGFLNFRSLSRTEVEATALRMVNAIKHRGPDFTGTWFDYEAEVALCHNRLSIIDLSPAGHQPMVSHSNRYIIAFNGEIYNHLELRLALQKNGKGGRINWRGHSDTETLLSAIEHWGIQEALQRAVGMFAFALWDKRKKSLFLARDRMGEKPLYYGWQKGALLFGSELKALKNHTFFSAEINRDALALQMRHKYIPAPYTIYDGVYKLLPGHYLELPVNGSRQEARLNQYWSLEESCKKNDLCNFENFGPKAISQLEELLLTSVQGQMLSDMPFGAFLSGGLDSSLIVAMMQALSPNPVKTFTIGFEETAYDESQHAKKIAGYLGTEHYDLIVSPKEAMDIIPKLPSIYDEPFSDPSQIPTFLLSQLCRQHVAVALSGDGADELFGGYTRYSIAQKIWNFVGLLPKPLRNHVSRNIENIPLPSLSLLSAPIKPFLSQRNQNIGDRIHKIAKFLDASDIFQIYQRLISHWEDPSSLVYDSKEPVTAYTNDLFRSHDDLSRMMAMDIVGYLPDDILCKVDRSSMAVSLETRMPFLDHRIVEFTQRLPLSMKINSGQNKWILRQVLGKYVPMKLLERPKTGFGIPIEHWLRGPLKDWAMSLLDKNEINADGFFNHDHISQKWDEHLSGNRNWQHQLWNVLMFQAWLKQEKNV